MRPSCPALESLSRERQVRPLPQEAVRAYESPLRPSRGRDSEPSEDSCEKRSKGLSGVYFQGPIGYPLRADCGPESALSAPLSPCSQVVDNDWKTRGVLGEISGFIHTAPPARTAALDPFGTSVKNLDTVHGFSTRNSESPTTRSALLTPAATTLSDDLHRVVHRIAAPLLRRLAFNSSFKERTVSSP